MSTITPTTSFFLCTLKSTINQSMNSSYVIQQTLVAKDFVVHDSSIAMDHRLDHHIHSLDLVVMLIDPSNDLMDDNDSLYYEDHCSFYSTNIVQDFDVGYPNDLLAWHFRCP